MEMDLHVFFLPFLAPGHMIPMVDMARLFAERGVCATIVTTAANAPLIQPTIDRAKLSHLNLFLLDFPSSEVGLPRGLENLTAFSTPAPSPAFMDAINKLELPFRGLLQAHRPDCLISDIYYHWSTGLAAELGIPRLVFTGQGCFPLAVPIHVSYFKPHENVGGDSEPFILPGLPHRIEMTRSQLPDFVLNPTNDMRKMGEAQLRSFGIVFNSFEELERGYTEILQKFVRLKVWRVGPLSLCNRTDLDKAERGDSSSIVSDECLTWLGSKKPCSVLYVCFGSLGRFTAAQLWEMASALEAAGHPFIWAVRHDGQLLPEGFEKRVVEGGQGLIIRDWAPQILILGNRAVGGFMTHCGWNSSLEGVCAGVPMITWPLFTEQFFNEKLIRDVLKIGVSVGARVCSFREEERGLVKGEEIRRAVEQLMGSGEEAEGRRRRAKELGERARRAVEEGGSSHNDLSRLIEELINLKARGMLATNS